MDDIKLCDIVDVAFSYTDMFGNKTTLEKSVNSDYTVDKTELGIMLSLYEDFLKACTFVIDGKHLDLVDD